MLWSLLIITAVEEINHNANEDYPPLSIIKDTHLNISIPTSSSQIPKIAIWKDERLEYLDIPNGLVELLQINDFTIEMILEDGPSQIAEKLGIDGYVAQIIFEEAKKSNY
jgi:hypothetical protein